MQNLYSECFTPTVTDADYKHRAKPSFLLNCFQIIAGKHAAILNASHESLFRDYDAYWVLSRVSVKIIRYPKIYEKTTFETWPLPPKPAFCERNYAVKDCDGNIIVTASSMWTVLDVKKHILRPIKTIGLMSPETFVETVNSFTLEKLPSLVGFDAQKAYEFEVRMTDLDQNIHVNNANYANYMQNAFTAEDFRDSYISSFQINYLSETKEFEKIAVSKAKIGENTYLVEGCNGSGKASFSAKLTFSHNEL